MVHGFIYHDKDGIIVGLADDKKNKILGSGSKHLLKHDAYLARCRKLVTSSFHALGKKVAYIVIKTHDDAFEHWIMPRLPQPSVNQPGFWETLTFQTYRDYEALCFRS